MDKMFIAIFIACVVGVLGIGSVLFDMVDSKEGHSVLVETTTQNGYTSSNLYEIVHDPSDEFIIEKRNDTLFISDRFVIPSVESYKILKHEIIK